MNTRVDAWTDFISPDEPKKDAFGKSTQPTPFVKKLAAATPLSLHLTTNKVAQEQSHNHPPSVPNVNVSHPIAAAIDADVAIQKGSALGQIAASVQQLNASGYIDYLHTGGNLFAKHPLEGFLNQIQPLNPAVFGVATGASVLGIPCTAITLISALRDITDNNQFDQTLDTYQNCYQQALEELGERLDSATDKHSQSILTRLQIEATQLLAITQFIKRLNHFDKRGNQFTVAGAASTIASAALTTGAQAGLVAVNHSPTSFASVGIETAAGLAAASAGIAGAALGIPAGIGSAGYGWYMTKKAEQQRKFFKEAYKTLVPMLKVREFEMSRDPSKKIEASYLRFLNTKLRQRIVFLRWFSRFSKGLFSGGFTSGATALAKGIALAVTAAGAGAALANPVVPVLLVTLGAVGLGIMALSSQQVFYRHSKHKRYYQQRISDDLELNRRWLSNIDIWHDGYSQKGFALRARFYQMIDQREQKRQEWLMSIATRPEQPRHFEPTRYSTDTTLATHTPVSLRKKMAAKLRAGSLRASAWTQSMRQNLNLSQAKAASRSARNAPGTLLNTDAVAAWLSDPNHRQQKIQLMRSLLNDQQEFVDYKLESREEVYQQRLKPNSNSANPPSESGTATTDKELHDLLQQQFDADSQQNKRFKEQLDSLDVSLAKLEEQLEKSNDIQDTSSLEQLQAQFIELQHGRLWDPEKNYDAAGADKKLAHYLLRGAALRARELRGMLVEAELDAASIRYKTYGTEGDLRQDQAKNYEDKLKENALKPQAMRAFVIRQNDDKKTARPDTAPRLPSASVDHPKSAISKPSFWKSSFPHRAR